MKGSCLVATAATRIEKMVKRYFLLVCGGTLAVEHSPQHPKFEGLIPAAAAGTWRDKNGKKSLLLIKCHTPFEMDNKARYFKIKVGQAF